MGDKMTDSDYDVIVVGSGPGGAAIYRELAKQRKKVLLLERGANTPVKETIAGIASVARECVVGSTLKAMTASSVGGTSNLYFGVCKLPTSETFARMGIDCSREVEEFKKELPAAELSDEFLTPQTEKVANSARQLGYRMKRNPMLIDQSKCDQGNYCYEAKWKPRSYVAEGLANGAHLTTGAVVQRIIIEHDRAVGVEYKCRTGLLGSRVCKAFGKRIVLSAGSFTTPKLLMDCGIRNIGSGGFFCHAAWMVGGKIPGLQGKEAFLGYRDLDIDLGEGVVMGDGTMNSSLFKLVMLGNRKWNYVFSHSQTLLIGISVNDAMGGELKASGRYEKRLTSEEFGKLRAAEAIAIKILKNAGARSIFTTKVMAGTPGGLLKVGQHLDRNLETRVRNLYVCDHSVMCDDPEATPVVSLICFGKYLAKHLLASLDNVQPQRHAIAV